MSVLDSGVYANTDQQVVMTAPHGGTLILQDGIGFVGVSTNLPFDSTGFYASTQDFAIFQSGVQKIWSDISTDTIYVDTTYVQFRNASVITVGIKYYKFRME